MLSLRDLSLPYVQIAAASIAASGAVLGARDPRLFAAGPALLAVVLLLVSPLFRLLFVVAGGMLVLQSPESLTAAKLLYFAGVGVALLAALLNRWTASSSAHWKLFPLLVMFVFSALALLASVFVAGINETPFQAWLRDAAPYILVAVTPVFALDASQSPNSRRFILGLFVIIGLLACLAFLVEWVQRRDLADLGLDSFLLPTPLPVAALFSYSAAVSFSDKRSNLGWTVLVFLIPSALLFTATRSALLLLAGPLAIALQRSSAKGFIRFGCVALLGALLFFGITTALHTTSNEAKLNSRLQTLGTVVSDPNSDPSYIERRAETEAAWGAFVAHPIFGQGPGHPIVGTSPWRISESFSVDTSVSFLAKFGLLGLAFLFGWLLAFRMSWSRLGLSLDDPLRGAFVGWIAIVAVNLPLSNPLEDKGFAFSLLMLLALLVAPGRGTDRETGS